MRIKLPKDMFLQAVAEGKVYYFVNKVFGGEPHFHIVIKRTDIDVLIFTCCTSQFDTIRRHIEAKKLPNTTLVWISPSDSSNPFHKDTYVNCNSYSTCTIEEFGVMYENEKVDFSGEISDDHFQQILIGLHDSPQIDEETKDMLPKPSI